jgi:adenine-specific DNA-methyltransferase
MPLSKLRPSFTFTEDRLKELQAVIPEAFADGKINWTTLQEALGEHLEEETQEHFGLTWPGKREARRLAAMPSKGTLVPQPSEGVNEDNTKNIFIEGDNLEVLKLLQKSYAGQVKMIFIDPPYNTGNDFVYVDDYSEPLETFLKRTEQVDEEGSLLTSNARSSGRYHSNWLSMMYPRLLLARQLLRDDGAIFISIDDNELSNLKSIMDEVFGEENFVNIVSVKTKPSAGASGGGEDKRLKKNVEFLVVYARNIEIENDVLRFRDVFEETELQEHIETMKKEDKSWKYTSVFVSRGEKEFVTTIEDGGGNDIQIFRHNNYERTTINALLKERDSIEKAEAEKTIYFEHLENIFSDTNAQSSIRARVMIALGEDDGLFSIEYIPVSGRNKGKRTTVYYVGKQKRQVIWLSDIAQREESRVILKGKLSTLWDDLNWNNVAKEGGITFPNGKKPTAFIQRMVELSTTGEGGEIVLDFFAGSGSTGHAVLNLNAKDNGERKFIAVQVQEQAKDFPEFDNIAELCKQRLRNSINEFEPMFQQQLGFLCYKLDRSHFKDWQPYEGREATQLETQFDLFETPLVDDWKKENLLTEILLLQGFPLDSQIIPLEEVDGNQVKRVHSEACAHELFVCLDAKVSDETIEHLHLRAEDILVTLDSALSDETKIRLADQCNLQVI